MTQLIRSGFDVSYALIVKVFVYVVFLCCLGVFREVSVYQKLHSFLSVFRLGFNLGFKVANGCWSFAKIFLSRDASAADTLFFLIFDSLFIPVTCRVRGYTRFVGKYATGRR